MADTGEGREIKERTGAKEAEIVSESKKLLQKSKTAKTKHWADAGAEASPKEHPRNDGGPR